MDTSSSASDLCFCLGYHKFSLYSPRSVCLTCSMKWDDRVTNFSMLKHKKIGETQRSSLLLYMHFASSRQRQFVSICTQQLKLPMARIRKRNRERVDEMGRGKGAESGRREGGNKWEMKEERPAFAAQRESLFSWSCVTFYFLVEKIALISFFNLIYSIKSCWLSNFISIVTSHLSLCHYIFFVVLFHSVHSASGSKITPLCQ